MTKFEEIDKLLEQNDGYLFSKDVERVGISRTYLASYVKERGLEKVSKGIYISPDAWEDELYILQLRYPKVIFSGETALYLHEMIDREYSQITVTVPPRFNRTRLLSEGVVIRQEQEASYNLGITELQTNFGNTVRAYDVEKTICDLVKLRGKTEVQHYQTAIKSYMRRKDKDLTRLLKYAETLKIRDEIMKYIEMMV